MPATIESYGVTKFAYRILCIVACTHHCCPCDQKLLRIYCVSSWSSCCVLLGTRNAHAQTTSPLSFSFVVHELGLLKCGDVDADVHSHTAAISNKINLHVLCASMAIIESAASAKPFSSMSSLQRKILRHFDITISSQIFGRNQTLLSGWMQCVETVSYSACVCDTDSRNKLRLCSPSVNVRLV